MTMEWHPFFLPTMFLIVVGSRITIKLIFENNLTRVSPRKIRLVSFLSRNRPQTIQTRKREKCKNFRGEHWKQKMFLPRRVGHHTCFWTFLGLITLSFSTCGRIISARGVIKCLKAWWRRIAGVSYSLTNFHANFQVTKIQSTLTDTPSKTDRQRTMKSSLCSEKYSKTEM